MSDGVYKRFPPGQEVEVYLNAHRTRQEGYQVYSVRDHRSRRVLGHTSHLDLRDSRFRVSEAGRQRVLRDRRKNVHAVIQGMIAPPPQFISVREGMVHYNPYLHESFIDDLGHPITESPCVHLRPEGVYALGTEPHK